MHALKNKKYKVHLKSFASISCGIVQAQRSYPTALSFIDIRFYTGQLSPLVVNSTASASGINVIWVNCVFLQAVRLPQFPYEQDM